MNPFNYRSNALSFCLLLPFTLTAQSSVLGRVELNSAGVTPHLGSLSGDALVPLANTPNALFLVDVMGGYASNATYLVSPGIGFRQVINNQIMGAFLFGDYEQTSLGTPFWNLSPGIEWITPDWDAHLNGYYATQTRHVIGSPQFASTLGDEQGIVFTSDTHNQYDQLMTPYALIGNGADIEVGYSLDKKANALRSRIYLGGYYYQIPPDINKTTLSQVQAIKGFTLGFSQAFSEQFKVSLFNSYDEVSNYRVGFSVSLTLGSESNRLSNDVHTRLLDTVARHVGIIGTGAGNYDQLYWQNEGLGLQYNNIYFLSPNGSGNGSYGNPMALTQSNLDTIHSNNPNGARLYLQGGNQMIYPINSSNTSMMGLSVYNEQAFYGRSNDYRTSANAADRPQISVDGLNNYNGFIIQDGHTVFSNLNLYSSTTGYGMGIVFNNASTDASSLSLSNMSISQFTTAVYVNHMSSGTFTLYANSSHFDHNTQTGNGAAAYGMNLLNTGTGHLNLYANHSSFNENSSSGMTNQAAGLSIYNASSGRVSAQIHGSLFNNNSATGSNTPIASGLYAYNNGAGLLNIHTSSSQFNTNYASYQAFGMEVINQNSGTLLVTSRDSQFSQNAGNALSAGLAAGNYGAGNILVSYHHSLFIPAADANSYPIYTDDTGTGTITIQTY